MAEYCYKCMNRMENHSICPQCHWNNRWSNEEAHILAAGTILEGHYLLGNKLGQGGFGITYIARDLTLDKRIAVKEFYPKKIVMRNRAKSNEVWVKGADYEEQWDSDCNSKEYEKARANYEKSCVKYEKDKVHFIQEGRVLARVDNLNSVVSVLNAFEENNTAYIVMEYLQGCSMEEYIQNRHCTMTVNEMLHWMKPIIQDLDKIHEMNVYHKDIAPDNIMITNDGTAKLIDFGSAQSEDDLGGNQLKRGYAPPEQYHGVDIGAWTDVYAVCATMYWLLTGTVPPEAPKRLKEDTCQSLRQRGVNVSAYLDRIFQRGLELDYHKRISSMKELMECFHRVPKYPMIFHWVETILVAGICLAVLWNQWSQYQNVNLLRYQAEMESNWNIQTYLSDLTLAEDSDDTIISNENFCEYNKMVYMRVPIEENLYYLIFGEAGNSNEDEIQAIMAGNFGQFCISGTNLYFRNEEDQCLYWCDYQELLQLDAQERYVGSLIDAGVIQKLSEQPFNTDFPFYLSNQGIYTVVQGEKSNQYEIEKIDLITDVSQKTQLKTSISLFQPYKDYLYFTEKVNDKTILNRMNLQGECLEQLTEFDGDITSLTIYRHKIYYLFNANNIENSCVGCIHLDGTGNQVLSEQQEGLAFYSLSGVVDGENIYYTCAEAGNELTNQLYCYNITENSSELISSDCGRYIATTDGEDYILYVSSDQHYVMKMRKNGSNPIRMQETASAIDITSLKIISGHVYYRMEDSIGCSVISDEIRLLED